MKKFLFYFFTFFFLIFTGSLIAFDTNNKSLALDFDVIKKEGKISGPTLLLIGGIQGDEPGGFNATNIFLQHYQITKGNIWVVPVINKHSMLRNHRGIYGDMNRKFVKVKKTDPEYFIINRIKNLITNEQIDAILHLHDGSGFYRPTYINSNMNPNRWGACCIIDQELLQGSKFPNLGLITDRVISYINAHLIHPNHRYYKHNTQTAKGNVEMEKALTYFAVRNHKSAFANEASKSLSLELRVYYHLLAIEGFLHELGIEYKRDFNLTPKRLYYLINDQNLWVKINHNIILPLYGLRDELKFFPLPKEEISKIPLDSPAYIVGLLERDHQVLLKYGNKLMTRLNVDPMDLDNGLEKVTFIVDGEKKQISVGSILEVKENVSVIDLPAGYRVNVIGFVKPNDFSSEPNESDVKITLKECISKFSIDKKGKIYRAEFYRGKKFAGMVLIKFL